MRDELVTLSDLQTILLYLVVICCSCFIAVWYEKVLLPNKELNPIIRIFVRMGIVLFPALLFGCRSDIVGWDTEENVAVFQGAENATFETILANRNAGFLAILSFLNLITEGNYNLAFFCIHLITLYLVIAGLERFSDKVLISIGWVVYLTYFGFYGMDQMRQIFAMAIWFWGIKYIFERRFLRYVIVVLIASIIHSSLILSLIMYFFIVSISKQNQLFGIVIISTALLLSIFSSSLFNILGNIFAGDSYYSTYFMDESVANTIEGTGSGLGILFNLLPFLYPIICYYKYFQSKIFWFMFLCFALIIPLRSLGYESYFLARMYLIPASMIVLLYPYAYRCIADQKKEKTLFIGLTIVLMAFYFCYFAFTSHGIMPYSFNFCS